MTWEGTPSYGFEMFNSPTPSARQLWYYLRAIGHVKRDPAFKNEHLGTEDGFLLHFVLRGQLRHRLWEESHTAGPGEVCLFDLGQRVSYDNPGRNKVEFYWTYFNGKDMPRVFAELRAERSPLFVKLNAARMKSLFRELLAIASGQPPAYEVKISALLTAILAELFACRAPRVSFVAGHNRTAPLSYAVRKAIDCITIFYDQPLVAKQMAAAAGQSVFYFSRRFHREVGMSPIAYLNQYRVEQAKQLLEASDKAIAEIARSVGLPDQNYFSRIFTQSAGVSPRQYRYAQQNKNR